MLDLFRGETTDATLYMLLYSLVTFHPRETCHAATPLHSTPLHGLPRSPRSDMVTRDTTHRRTRRHRHNPSTTQPPFATRTTRASQEAVMQPNTVLPHVQNMDSRNCKQRLYRCMRSRYSKQTLMPRGHRKHVKAVRPCARTTNPQAHALVL